MSTGIIGVSAAETGRYTAFYASLACLQRPEGNIIGMFSTGAVISQNRNRITEAMLKHNADWVLYLDDDQILQPNTLMRLLAADVDIISAHYTKRQAPFNSVLMDKELPDGTFTWKYLNPTDRGIIPVAAAGAGCLLVKRKVIDALEPPYWTLGQINPASWGDDLHFCSRVRKAGFEIYADLDAPIGHMMTGAVWPSYDDKQGWVANFAQDIPKGAIATWLMPLPGDI